MKTNIYTFFCSLILLVSLASATTYKLYTIRSALYPVLPAVFTTSNKSNSIVTLEEFSGSNNQLWRLENGAEPGTFLITNVARDNNRITFTNEGSISIYTTNPNNFYYHSWIINSDGHIVNLYTNKHITANNKGAYGEVTGQKLTLENPMESDKQKFYFIQMN